MKSFILSIIQYVGRTTHNIRVQLLCAIFYGLIHLYGIKGAILILVKVRKLQNARNK